MGVNFVVMDQSLRGMSGHYYEYDLSVIEAIHPRAASITVFSNKDCDSAAVSFPGAHLYPWFSMAWDQTNPTKRWARDLLGRLPATLQVPLAQALRRVYRLVKGVAPARRSDQMAVFQQEFESALNRVGVGPETHVFIPTIRLCELHIVWSVVASNPAYQAGQFHIVLRRDAAEMEQPDLGYPGISALFRRMAADPATLRAFRFYCDTEELCDDYRLSAAGAVDFHLLPIPYPQPQPDLDSLQKWRAEPGLKLVYLGNPRAEKGFDLLPSAVQALKDASIPHCALFQSVAPKGYEEPEVTAARMRLAGFPSVKLLDQPLTSPEFQSLLLAADIVLLPYRPEAYRARSSGVLVQAIAAGKPIVVPTRCWLGSQASNAGAVLFDGEKSFGAAVIDAARRLPELEAQAQARAPAYASFHRAETLVDILLGKGGACGNGNS